jgi:glutamate-1-semialdehyde aminotransferase
VGAKSRNFLFATLPFARFVVPGVFVAYNNDGLGYPPAPTAMAAAGAAVLAVPQRVVLLASTVAKAANHLAKLLQKIVASQKTQHIASHVATIFCNHLANLLQKIIASKKTQHIASHVATIFCNHLAKLLQKIIASHKTQHIASHVATIFCNHLAKLLQKIVASQKTQHIAS